MIEKEETYNRRRTMIGRETYVYPLLQRLQGKEAEDFLSVLHERKRKKEVFKLYPHGTLFYVIRENAGKEYLAVIVLEEERKMKIDSREHIKELQEDFELIKYLEQHNLVYNKKEGPTGWVNIQCPFCSDPSMHCEISSYQGSFFHCWICGKSGDILTLIQELEGISFPLALSRLESFQRGDRTRIGYSKSDSEDYIL